MSIMEESSFILALFFSDEYNLVFEEIKHYKEFSSEQGDKLKMLPFQFLGPIFMTAASGTESAWRINFIEYSMALKKDEPRDADILQTFFSINSTIEVQPGRATNLFALIGSPYTEDLNVIHQKITKYIHPSIIQGIKLNQILLGNNFIREKLIKQELIRGLHLIEYYLGSSRKMYWRAKKKYYCIGLIERKVSEIKKSSFLYTFEQENSMRKQILDLIPSYHVMSVLPDYYENLLNETLKIFDKKGVFPNLRQIDLTRKEQEVLYFEEYTIKNGIKRTIGCILIPLISYNSDVIYDISFFQKRFRNILDNNEELKTHLKKFNPNFSVKGWNITTNDDLNQIASKLDRTY